MKLRAAASLYAALLLALGGFASSALAGDHGHGGGDHGHGNAPSSQPSHQDNHQHGHAGGGDQSTQSTTTSDNSNGVKPSNTTKHDTYEKASSDKTKKYGNGQTAGQIATKSGYGDATLHGPGNSQPHKVNCGGHEVDVHALKHKSCGSVAGAKHEEHQSKPKHAAVDVPNVTFCDMESATSGKLETKPATELLKHEFNGSWEEARDIVPPFTYNGQSYSQIWTAANQAIFNNGCNAASQVPGTETHVKSDHKITICHATGSATNPYVEITVDEHALKHGHTTAKGDIIPAPAGGCPTAAAAPAEVPSVTFCDMQSPTSGKLETKPATEVIKHELNGTPEEARDIVPPFALSGQSYSQIWTDANAAIFKNGCNAPSQVESTTTTEQSCTETKTVTEQVVVGVKHFIGPKGSGRYVIIHPNPHSSHFRDKHPDELIYQTVTKTETVPSSCPSTTTTESTTTTAAAATTTQQTTTTETTQTTTTTAAAVAATPPTTTTTSSQSAAPAGGVLGAVAPLHNTVKPKPAGGVLGATVRLGKSVGGTTLPFTGLPLWIFAMVAAGLILVGAVARRAGAES